MSSSARTILLLVVLLGLVGIFLSFSHLSQLATDTSMRFSTSSSSSSFSFPPIVSDVAYWNSLQETAAASAALLTSKLLSSSSSSSSSSPSYFSIFSSSFASSLQRLDEQARVDLIEHSNHLAMRLVPQMTHGFGLSPLSVSYALSIMHLGSTGTVNKEFSSLFNGQYSLSELQMIKELYGNNQSTIIHMSNCVVVNKEQVKFLNHSFVDVMSKLAEVKVVEFSKDLGKTSNEVSYYFQQNTDSHVESIGHVLKPKQSIDIINTVYFRAPWYTSFETSVSSHLNFTQLNGHKRSIKMLKATVPLLPYYENDMLQLFEIAFQPREFVMGIMLPKRVKNTRPPSLLGSNITQLFSYVKLLKPYEEVTKSGVSPEVHIPKMRQQKMLRLAPQLLKTLGVKDAFDVSKSQDGFSRIAKMGATLSEVVHEAFLNVDEFGANSLREWEQTPKLRKETEESPTVVIEATHTFIYYIRHKPTNMLLYVGDFDG